jgi:hypothetical protein
METTNKTYKLKSNVDRQATSLLDITFWSNIVVIAVVIGINIVNIVREGTGGERVISFASPEFVLILSTALCVWMLARAISALVTKRRLKTVFLAVSDDGIAGVSMPEPMTNKQEKRFSVAFDQVCEVRTVEVAITKKHNVPSLKIGTADEWFIIPVPERLQEIVAMLSEML